MNDTALTAIATVLLVLVGVAQIIVLVAQKRQTRIALVTEYRRLWRDCKIYWGTVIFIGNSPEEYYQVVDEITIAELKEKVKQHSLHNPTIWARDSIQNVCNVMSEISTRILQGHLRISDAYPIFGTELLRHSRPLRILLDSKYKISSNQENENNPHTSIRREMQDWLIYHDGIRRRCLILIDLLWAEAVRLEDLPAEDIKSAAYAKNKNGKFNRTRVYKEVIRLNGIRKFVLGIRLCNFLKYAEFFSIRNPRGIKKSRLQVLDTNFSNRILRNK